MLATAGWRVTLLEASERLGGLIRTERVEGLQFEDGPDSIVASRPSGRRLVERLGLGPELVGSAPGRASVAWRGGVHPLPERAVLGVPADLRTIARSRLFGPAQAARIALDLVLPRGATRGDVAVGTLLRRRLGGAFTDRLARPLLGGISGGDLDELSAEAAFPQLVAWERDHRSLIVGARAAARRAANGPPFLAPRGGMDRIVERLVARLGSAELACGEPAIAMARSSGGVTVTTPRRTLDAQGVVLAVGPAVAARLGAGLDAAAATRLGALMTRSAAVVHLAYPGMGERGRALGHGLLVAPGEPVSIAGLTAVSNKWPHRAPAGTLLLRAYLGDRFAAAGAVSDARLIAQVRDDLATLAGLRAEPSVALVRRHPDALPRPAVGHLAQVRAIRAALAAAGPIALVGGAYDGIGIPAIAEGIERHLAGMLHGTTVTARRASAPRPAR